MKMNVIFLDFDGVLNSMRSVVAAGYSVRSWGMDDQIKDFANTGFLESGFDPLGVALLRHAVEELDAKIVVSSTWRKEVSFEAIKGIFKYEFKWENVDDIFIGVTPDLRQRRGYEILDWIEKNTVGVQNFRYAIIDDNSDMLAFQHERLVQTDAYEGFIFKDYKKLMELFDIKVTL